MSRDDLKLFAFFTYRNHEVKSNNLALFSLYFAYRVFCVVQFTGI